MFDGLMSPIREVSSVKNNERVARQVRRRDPARGRRAVEHARLLRVHCRGKRCEVDERERDWSNQFTGSVKRCACLRGLLR